MRGDRRGRSDRGHSGAAADPGPADPVIEAADGAVETRLDGLVAEPDAFIGEGTAVKEVFVNAVGEEEFELGDAFQ